MPKDNILHIGVDENCSWELLCEATVLLSEVTKIKTAPTTIWYLPIGWAERLRQSLYEVIAQLEQKATTSFIEKNFPNEYLFSHISEAHMTLGHSLLEHQKQLEVLSQLIGNEDMGCQTLISELFANKRSLSVLKNRHKDRRCFIIGNGPSLKQTDLRRLRKEITFGCNAIFLIEELYPFKPTYYVIEDRLIAEDRAEEINSFNGSVKLYPWDQRCRLNGNAYYPLVRTYEPYPQFSDDISCAVYTGWTVTYISLQLAWYMGIRDIYLVGVDGTYVSLSNPDDNCVITSTTKDHNHFHPDYYGPGRRWHRPQPERIKAAYECAASFALRNNGRIQNATRGGQLNIFPRVDYDVVTNNLV